MKTLKSPVSFVEWAATRLRQRKSPEAFTLIELLVVIAIIAILAALVLNTAGFIQKKAARSRAETEVAALSAALESYKADNGDYPRLGNTTNSGGLGTNSLYLALSPGSGKVYFEFNKSMTNTSGIVDPFGQAYQYRYPGDANKSGTNFFDLWSYGGATGNKASDNPTNHVFWIVNW